MCSRVWVIQVFIWSMCVLLICFYCLYSVCIASEYFLSLLFRNSNLIERFRKQRTNNLYNHFRTFELSFIIYMAVYNVLQCFHGSLIQWTRNPVSFYISCYIQWNLIVSRRIFIINYKWLWPLNCTLQYLPSDSLSLPSSLHFLLNPYLCYTSHCETP